MAFRVTWHQYDIFHAAAVEEDISVSEWMRSVLMAEAETARHSFKTRRAIGALISAIRDDVENTPSEGSCE